MKLVDAVMRSMVAGKVFQENQEQINHMHFSPDGSNLITSSDDDQIIVYDCQRGLSRRAINSKKYGVDLIHYTHHKNNVIHASTKENDIIRYLNVEGNKYISYFRGHTKRVVTLSTSPSDDTFLSGSLDKTIRLWDLRSQGCQGVLNATAKPVAAFDPEGLIFAAGINSELLKLYDLRSFDKGPFSSFKVGLDSGTDWTGLKFSPDGKMILVSTNGDHHKILDSFSGQLVHNLTGFTNPKKLSLEASFSPDSQFVICGSSDGRLFIWNTETGQQVCSLQGGHTLPVKCVQFNPKYMMMSSTCKNMVFWLPGIEEEV